MIGPVSLTNLISFPVLPISAALPEIEAILDSGRNAILIAPPGAGKTTLVPLHLLQAPWRDNGRIILVEPRRVAVRSAAQRMASLLQENTGQTVGYRTRTDHAISDATRIEVVTEGLLLRRLLTDPLLDGIACILFDEVHERSLDLDTALAFALDLQRTLRPELRLVAMSATTDGRAFTNLLDGVLIESEVHGFPLEIRHARRDLTTLRELPDLMARAIRDLLANEEGDILAFLPGVAEIRRCANALTDTQALILPLYGELDTFEQDLALKPAKKRKVVLATSIAETSLTVPGVRLVVDGGFRRGPRLDVGSGFSRLETLRISRAAAAQRAGRAGREAPGIAVRLWTETTGRAMIPHDMPEILNSDLSGHCLDTAAWQQVMGTAPEELAFLDTPPTGARLTALGLLRDLGSLDDEGRITTLGRSMARLGAQPRLAAMMCTARSVAEKTTATMLAALLEERDPLRPRFVPGQRQPAPPADIRIRLALIEGTEHHPATDRTSLARICQSAERYKKRLGLNQRCAPDPSCAAALLAAGFPDRVAMAMGETGRYRLSGGGLARLSATEPMARETLLVAPALHMRTATEICLAAPLDLSALPDILLSRTEEQVETALDPVSGNVIARRRLRLGALILRDRSTPAEPEEIRNLLLSRIRGDFQGSLGWTDSCRQFRARLELARTHLDAAYPAADDETLSATLEDWLVPHMDGLTRLSQVHSLDLLSLLQYRLNYDQLRRLDRDLPTRLTLPGAQPEIDYLAATPTVAARAQAFYGLKETPHLADGRIGLQFALLSPAGRPQAITADIAAFWTTGWADMRRDMRGRYPKHDWPDNPALALPPPLRKH